MMALNPLDLNEVAPNSPVRLGMTSSTQEDPQDADIRRAKDVMSFGIAMGFVLSVFAFCGYIMLSKDFSAEDKKWATTLAGSIISAFFGYLFGKRAAHEYPKKIVNP